MLQYYTLYNFSVAFAAAVQCDFPIGWVDLIAASARLDIWTRLHWALNGHLSVFIG